MKNRVLSAVIFILAGFLIAIGPHYIFSVCKGGEMPMNCQKSADVLIYFGVAIALLGLVYLFLKNKVVDIVLSVLELVGAVFSYLIPAVIVGVCGMASMHCRAVTLPALTVIAVVLGLFSIGNIIFLSVKKTRT